jgi:hypothetical protein
LPHHLRHVLSGIKFRLITGVLLYSCLGCADTWPRKGTTSARNHCMADCLSRAFCSKKECSTLSRSENLPGKQPPTSGDDIRGATDFGPRGGKATARTARKWMTLKRMTDAQPIESSLLRLRNGRILSSRRAQDMCRRLISREG